MREELPFRHPNLLGPAEPEKQNIWEFEIRYVYESNALKRNAMIPEETRAVLETAAEGKDMAFCAELLESMRRKEKEEK